MRVLRFDSIGGASGDMVLATLVDLGADLPQLKRRLARLHAGKFDIHARRTESGGIAGTRVTVTLRRERHQHHRNLADITRILRQAHIPEHVRRMSTDVFARLARAEAHVHGTSPNKVHFHEVGALDAIVDIVGSCLALDMLGIDNVIVGPLPMGHGTISMHHGIMPNPPPAVLELLKNRPVVEADEPFELVTPTGAAILSSWSARPAGAPAKRVVTSVVSVGYGIGHRPLNHRPNILRATLMETSSENTVASDKSARSCLVLETNIDDMNPQLTGHLADVLVKAGAIDAFATPVCMKKGRPGALLTVLCKPGDRNRLLDIIFQESTTFGIREYPVRRSVLTRKFRTINTRFGRIRMKIGAWKGRIVTCTPEFEDVLACARKHGVPARKVLSAIHA